MKINGCTANDHCSESALISREVKNACGVFLLSIRSRFLRGELRTPCSLQVARGTSHDARQGCRVALSHNICAFYAAKCGSERYKDVTRTDTARNSLMKSEVEKRLRRFSFIGYAKKSCAGNFALRARCKSRIARNYFLKSGGEKQPSRFSFINTLAISPHCSKSRALVLILSII